MFDTEDSKIPMSRHPPIHTSCNKSEWLLQPINILLFGCHV